MCTTPPHKRVLQNNPRRECQMRKLLRTSSSKLQRMYHPQKIQQKMYPILLARQTLQHLTPTDPPRPTPAGLTYAQVTQGQLSRSQPNEETTPTVHKEQPSNDLQELKHMMTNLINQINTLINLISALVTKTK